MIRKMKEEDAQRVSEMGWHIANSENSSFSICKYDGEVMKDNVKNWWTKDLNYLALVAEDENKHVYGMFVGFIQHFFFSHRVYAGELLLYTDQNKRGTYAAIKILKKFERWARLKGACQIRPGISTNININRTRDLYVKLGYDVVGYNFLKNTE